jgi:hypothetical protein
MSRAGRKPTHGQTKTAVYAAYHHAEQRCNNSNDKSYKNYGGRGIKFLFSSFEEFFRELGTKPKGKVLDREDNEGNYEPGNVQWVTYLKSQRNRRMLHTNTSGFTNVYRTGRRWKSVICVAGKLVHLGMYNTAEEASLVAKAYKVVNA